MTEQNSYKGAVFAGGGSRCFWQAGFWQSAAPALGLAPNAVAAVSAGASTACHVFAGEIEAAMDYYQAAHNHRAKYAPGAQPFLPDPTGLKIYREALESVLQGEPFQRLKQGPDLRIFMSRPRPGPNRPWGWAWAIWVTAWTRAGAIRCITATPANWASGRWWAAPPSAPR